MTTVSHDSPSDLLLTWRDRLTENVGDIICVCVCVYSLPEDILILERGRERETSMGEANMNWLPAVHVLTRN